MILMDEEKLLDCLRGLGYNVDFVSRLVSLGVKYDDAIPVLLEALQSTADESLREWCARALSLPWVEDEVVEALIEQFALGDHGNLRRSGTQWAIGNALWSTWRDSYFDDYGTLAQSRQLGTSRRMVVFGFEKTRLKDRAVRVLLSLLDDQDVNGHAVAAIAKLGQELGRRALEDAVDDPRRWVRNAAKRGVITLEKLAEK